MRRGPFQDFGQVVGVPIHRARHEGRLRADGHAEGVKRLFDGPQRRCLGDVAWQRGGRILALCEAVDAVVEEDDVDIHVPAQAVEQVVAPDGEAVSVSGDHPHAQVRICDLQARGQRGRTPVDGVDAVGFHIVGKAAGASDPGYKDDFLLGDAQVRQDALHLRQNRVVSAARAPADLLVRYEVFPRQRRWGCEYGFGHAFFSRLYLKSYKWRVILRAVRRFCAQSRRS